MINITPITALQDNYIWLIIAQNQCIIIDPADAKNVIAYLTKNNLSPAAIFITHHHADHTAGIGEIIEQFDDVKIFGSNLNDNDAINILDLKFTAITTPGHTNDHIAYYGHGVLFSGDTLFTAGCGRIFEGTAEQLYNSLIKLKNLPNETLVYCAHEYTLHNLQFARLVEPNNLQITRRITNCQRLLQKNKPTVPSTIGLEKATNPFLRCDHPEVIKAAQKYSKKSHISNPAKVFSILREWKDTF